ncbi:UNVERIFIED_CONTAM: DNA-directed RNA polymerases I and III subunit RPAC2 [Sesamum calycinum]
MGLALFINGSGKRTFKAVPGVMEHGSFQDQSQATFSFTDEDHTLANSLRYTLNQDPRVTFCGYSIPHPADARVNIRVQTTGDPAREVLKDSCQDLMLICQHVRSTFDQAVMEFKSKKGLESMNIRP